MVVTAHRCPPPRFPQTSSQGSGRIQLSITSYFFSSFGGAGELSSTSLQERERGFRSFSGSLLRPMECGITVLTNSERTLMSP